jgi:hypothetical protein
MTWLTAKEYSGALGMLLHINGKFIMAKIKYHLSLEAVA